MGRFVIVAYTPKPGKGARLLNLVKKHLDVLRTEKLVTEKPAYVMKAADGTFVEIFEWRSAEAIAKAHNFKAVQALWEEFAEVCDYTPLTNLDEAKQMFAEFEAVEAE